jgi:hypothetical protein
MKLKILKSNLISPEEVNTSMIVVGIHKQSNEPLILMKRKINENGWIFGSISSPYGMRTTITGGNGFSLSKKANESLSNFLIESSQTIDIEVFEGKDWKKALSWLIEHGK